MYVTITHMLDRFWSSCVEACLVGASDTSYTDTSTQIPDPALDNPRAYIILGTWLVLIFQPHNVAMTRVAAQINLYFTLRLNP